MLRFSRSRRAAEAAGGPAMRLQASAKVPLADPERGFGMGTWDVGGGLALSKHLGGPFVFVGICRLVHRALTVCKMTSRLPSVSVIS